LELIGCWEPQIRRDVCYGFFLILMLISLVLTFPVNAEAELEQGFDGQLCQEYLYQKL